ncbi:hypothetical protein WDU94_001149 [Cyamophila willieti]
MLKQTSLQYPIFSPPLQNGGGSTADISGGNAQSPPPAQCKSCGKNVFVMEQIKAEKQTWHKNCFRCKECNKQLTLDTYSSHEGVLYCKPHFRELFKPKAVVESPDPEPSKCCIIPVVPYVFTTNRNTFQYVQELTVDQ